MGGPDHFFVEFEVPPGTAELEVRHDDLSDVNILDFGLDDARAGGAGYRGWGGGTTEPIVVNETAASRAYVPGPIRAGTWRVIVGKAKVVASPARYRIEVELRTTPTLVGDRPRAPYVPPPPRKTETRYYAGDLHVHSRESTDAAATLEENIALAKQRGLEWIEISDHNTVTQLDYFNDVHAKEPGFLLIPGIEYTTYAGHANAIGATKFVDHKIGQPGVTIETGADAIRAQGAILSINHPVLDIGDLCIGCAWSHELDPVKIGGVEIGTLGVTAGAQLFSERALAFWDALLDKGAKVPGLGGSDDHRAGTSTGLFPAKVGSPTTLVRATELSTQGLLEGIRRGATVVKLDGPDDAMVELEAVVRRDEDAADAALAFPGDTLGVRSIFLRARVTGGVGQTVRFVKNGAPEDAVAVTSDPFVHAIRVAAPEQGEDRWRAEALVDERPRTVTSHVWLVRDPAGPEAEAPSANDDGCGVAPDGRSRAPWFVVALAAIAVALRGRRRSAR
ncbi:MAG: CehA/McbA family metallohydrolase [Labilithrix sp.]|nr:CehA/McbA family metallohydrolase [Labilithrix sp.]